MYLFYFMKCYLFYLTNKEDKIMYYAVIKTQREFENTREI